MEKLNKSMLKDSTNMGIYQSFWKAEFDRMKPAYDSLERKWHSLKWLIEEFRGNYDPITKHEENKSMMSKFASVAKSVRFSGFTNGDKYCQGTRKIMDKVNFILGLYNCNILIQEEFYRSIISSAKNTDGSFKDLDYSDEVQRKAVPVRNLAEVFLKTSQAFETNVYNAKRHFMNLARGEGYSNKKICEERRLVPSVNAVNALHDAVREYKCGEFDRIYRI